MPLAPVVELTNMSYKPIDKNDELSEEELESECSSSYEYSTSLNLYMEKLFCDNLVGT